MKNLADVEFSSTTGAGMAGKILSSQRRKMFSAFMDFKCGSEDSILEVGLTSLYPLESKSYLPAWLPPRERALLTSCAIVVNNGKPWRHSAAVAHGENYAESRRLPYADGSFDWVFCSEVIEHAGANEHQLQLLKELHRVARKGLFLTTENRRHPLEFNTGLPFVHWLPKAERYRALKLLGKHAWASESLLNPLDSEALGKMVADLPGNPSADIGHLRVVGIKAHFFLMLKKSGSGQV